MAKRYNVLVCTKCNRLPKDGSINVIEYNPGLLGSYTLSKSYIHIGSIIKFRKSIDLIHIPYSSKHLIQDYYLILTKRILNIPYVIRIHGGGMHPSRPHFLQQAFFGNASGIIAVSDPLKEEYEKRHGRKVEMIPSMLPYLQTTKTKAALRKEYKIDLQDVVILFLGSIKMIKGPDILLKTFLDLGLEYINKYALKLVFAGDGPLKIQLEHMVDARKMRPWVHFLGNVPHERVCELYRLSDIYVIPSSIEARPLSLSEALYNGLPAIGSNIPTITNIISHGENGLIFDLKESGGLVNKLKMLIKNPDLRRKIGQAAKRSYRDNYSFQRMIDQYCEFYERILTAR